MAYHKLKTILSLSIVIFYLLSSTIADDAAFMFKLAEALHYPLGWSNSTHSCKWVGVLCDNDNFVTSINLTSKLHTGTLPSDLDSLSQLTALSLHNNSLSGPLPSLANLSLLQTVFLGFNNFSSIPAGCFQGLTNMQTLRLSNNINLAPWIFPTDLTQFSKLDILDLRETNLIGSLPDSFNSLLSLRTVLLSNNNLTGVLPASLSSMNQLSRVWLHKNRFTGPIPDLSKCKYLFDVQLGDNLLTGIVPTSLMTLSRLKHVSLDNNMLQGPVPLFDYHVNVTLRGNRFCNSSPGRSCEDRVTTLFEIAAALGYPLSLAYSWIGNDPCMNWSLIVCTGRKIITVNMTKQNFNGTISPAFVNLKDLRYLYLSGNNFTGSIPESLTALPQLEILDVSNNNLSGKVPKFSSTVKLTTTGNLLLGMAFDSGPTSGSGDISPVGSPPVKGTNTSLSSGWIAGITIIVLFIVGVVFFVSYKCYAKSHHQGHGQSNVFEGGNATISIQVLCQATNNFSEDNILGRGGFGVVYCWTL